MDVHDLTPKSMDGQENAVMNYPPKDIRETVNTVARRVARFGLDFEEKTRQREAQNPQFAFLSPTDRHHAYYKRRVQEIAAVHPGLTNLFDSKAKSVAEAKNSDFAADNSSSVSCHKCKKPKGSGDCLLCRIHNDHAQHNKMPVSMKTNYQSSCTIASFVPRLTQVSKKSDEQYMKGPSLTQKQQSIDQLEENCHGEEGVRKRQLPVQSEKSYTRIVDNIPNGVDDSSSADHKIRSQKKQKLDEKTEEINYTQRRYNRGPPKLEFGLSVTAIQKQILSDVGVSNEALSKGLACAKCWGTDTTFARTNDKGKFVCNGCGHHCIVRGMQSVWDDFYYRDSSRGEIKGPFVQRQMQEWYKSGFFSENTEFSVNDGLYRTIKELNLKFGNDWPFCVEKDKPIGDNVFYYRKVVGGCKRGPLSAEEMQFLYENNVVITDISTDGEKFVPLDAFLQDKDMSYPFGVRDSLPIDETGWNSTSYFFDDGVVKGPFSAKGMQMLYEYSLPGSLDHVNVAMVDTTHFDPIANYIEENGCRYPFGRELTEMEKEKSDTKFYYIDEDVRGPFVKSQMQCWYERKFIQKNTRISTNKKRFMTLEQLILRNGDKRPFYGDNCEAKKTRLMDTDQDDEFRFKDGDNPEEGPYVHEQMQHLYECGRFSDREILVSRNGGYFGRLEDLVARNGSKKPFVDEECDGDQLEHSDYNMANIKEYFYRDTETSNVKGPFVAQQMQRYYDNELFENREMRFSEDGESFQKLSYFTEMNGQTTPFYKSTCKKLKGFFYRDTQTGEKRGPFVEAQMRRWYDKQVFNDATEISVNGAKNFVTLQFLVRLNGNVNPFVRDGAFRDKKKDLFHLRFRQTSSDLGPFVEEQMRMWYLRGWFDTETRISKNFEEYKTLVSIKSEYRNGVAFCRSNEETEKDAKEEEDSSNSSDDGDQNEDDISRSLGDNVAEHIVVVESCTDTIEDISDAVKEDSPKSDSSEDSFEEINASGEDDIRNIVLSEDSSFEEVNVSGKDEIIEAECSDGSFEEIN